VDQVDSDIVISRRTDEKYSTWATPKVCAWDIETTKPPLMFPDARNDCIMMISYMLNDSGYLIVNREIVSEDIEDFDYTPLPEYQGPFTIFNVANERELLLRWFEHLREEKPCVHVTYNGDNFDFPFVDQRARIHGLDLREQIGYWKDMSGDYRSTYGIHMDCLNWVVRDSYLPQGSHGLKEVTKKLLGYNPIEIHPEEMVRCAQEDPQTLASYSVSDAVSTYYLYKKYIEGFVFSLCNIIPMPPDEVLRKGSGTLCETLLMVNAFTKNIICPNKYRGDPEKMYKGHLIDSESYIGGHVKALQSGVFRSDIPQKFQVNPDTFDSLINKMDSHLKFAVEGQDVDPDSLKQLKDSIVAALTSIRDTPNRVEKPRLFHLDVGAMYPNIILTNRLQPSSIVDEITCASCVYNNPSNDCKRRMTWHSTVEYYTANKSEYLQIKRQIETETFPGVNKNDPPRIWSDLMSSEQVDKLKERMSAHCRKAYKKIYEKSDTKKEATVCMRENPFYVDSVRAFRDRRVELKDMSGKWKSILREAKTPDEIDFAKKKCVIYDSLQLAHKCILNSFYGYVMRKASRWYSMEMAGIVTYTGAQIIKVAHEFTSDIGTPLELDTDGIWCTIPASFPYNVEYKLKDGKQRRFNYPCVVMNAVVHEQFTNHQYQNLVDTNKRLYEKTSECSIYFEVDGPYRAMILPASQQQGKGIAKKYAVFNDDTSLAELKGFEIKRRGELQLIKLFQEDLFKTFLKGGTLSECYQCVGEVANRYLDYLYSKGEHLDDEYLFKMITESSNMKKTVAEYGNRKSARITTAKRLAELFGDDSIVREKGLVCEFIVSKKPESASVTERCIPVSVFKLQDVNRAISFLKKWTKDNSIASTDIREILDWSYYIERFGSSIQKLIVIPSGKQGIENPVPRVSPPDWLKKEINELNDTRKQQTITSMFSVKKKTSSDDDIMDLENFGDDGNKASGGPRVTKHKKKSTQEESQQDNKKRKRVESGGGSENEDDEDKQQKKKRNLGNQVLKLHKKFVTSATDDASALVNDKHFPQWLSQMKGRWKQMRDRRKKLKAGKDPGPSIAPFIPTSNTMGGFLKKQSEVVKYSQWEIIQIQKTAHPGIFKFFFMIDKGMHSMNINVKRHIYVNYRHSDTNAIGQSIKAILPRARPSFDLREHCLDETQYQNEFKEQLEQLGHQIEGVYESQVPSIFRVVTDVGCICELNKNAKAKLDNNNTLCSSDLKTVREASKYLKNPPKKIYMYHSNHERIGGIVGLFIFATMQAKIYIIQPTVFSEQPSINFQKILKDAYNKFKRSSEYEPNSETDEIMTKLEFNHYEYVQSKEEAFEKVHLDLETYQRERRGPTVFLSESTYSVERLLHCIPILSDYPVIRMAFNDDDNKYPALGWIQSSTKLLMTRLLPMTSWFETMIQYSRYAKTPIGNIEPDFTVYLYDLIYARLLKSDNQLLWISESSRPDLGGMEGDDILSIIASEEMHKNIEVNHSGMYNGMCVELELFKLDINSILQSQHINDLEGTNYEQALAEIQDQVKNSKNNNASGVKLEQMYDDSVLCASAFRVLKSMISALFSDVQEDENYLADMLLMSFYRWLRSSNAKLYDPSLNRMIYKLMKKVFLQLLATLKKLGATIVYADLNRIVLSTNKIGMNEVQEYIQFITGSIAKNNLFTWIDMRPKKYFSNLLWMNPSNYAGIELSLKKREESQNDSDDDEEMQENNESTEVDYKIFNNWDILNYLHPTIQQKFIIVISTYIQKIFEYNSEVKGNWKDETIAEKLKEHAQKIIEEFFTPNMLLEVDSLTSIIDEAVATSADNDKQRLILFKDSFVGKNPKLEFAKAVCHVLQLDKNVKDAVTIMKSNLLKLLSVRDFSEQAKYQRVTRSFTIPDVICSYCNSHTDIDLCKVPANDKPTEFWKCFYCRHTYDKQVIENRLLEYLHTRSVAYQVQDLKCSKCSQIKADNLSSHCECSGEWICKEPKERCHQTYSTLLSIAKFYGFNWLQENLEWLLNQ
jgi:DNA polymerase epsilon subunit 1